MKKINASFILPVLLYEGALASMMRYFSTTIGQKFLMAISSLMLIVFILAHLAGNLEIFLGQDAINDYTVFLHSMPKALWGLRILVILASITHVYTSIKLALYNKNMRPISYAVKKNVKATLASRTMMISGLVVLAFLVYHLAHFTFHWLHPEYSSLIDEKGRVDVYSMVIAGFQNTYVAFFYILAQLLLGMHLSHGFVSAPQTLGLSNRLLCNTIRRGGALFAWLIAALFISIPLAVWTGFLSLHT